LIEERILNERKNMEKELILASQSRYKRGQMKQLGIPFSAENPRCVEDRVENEMPEKAVLRLSRKKALSLAAPFPDAMIIASDQGVEIDGELLGKPRSVSVAEHQLARMSGREHRLLTALVVYDTREEKLYEELDVCRMKVRELSKDKISTYVAADLPLDCAGSYKFESKGIALFRTVEAQDPTAIIGLPLLRLCGLLEKAGVSIF